METKICSHPSNAAFRSNWDETFGGKSAKKKHRPYKVVGSLELTKPQWEAYELLSTFSRLKRIRGTRQWCVGNFAIGTSSKLIDTRVINTLISKEVAKIDPANPDVVWSIAHLQALGSQSSSKPNQ